MEVLQPSTLTVLEAGQYTSRELRIILSRYRQKSVPDRTLRWWRNQIGIEPNQHNAYDEQDLKILIRLVRWLNRGGTVEGFKSLLKQELQQCH